MTFISNTWFCSKYVGGNRVNWTYGAIWYIELQDKNYKNYFTLIFIVFIYFRTKSFAQKTEPYFTFVWFGLGWQLVLQYQKFYVFGGFSVGKVICIFCFLGLVFLRKKRKVLVCCILMLFSIELWFKMKL